MADEVQLEATVELLEGLIATATDLKRKLQANSQPLRSLVEEWQMTIFNTVTNAEDLRKSIFDKLSQTPPLQKTKKIGDEYEVRFVKPQDIYRLLCPIDLGLHHPLHALPDFEHIATTLPGVYARFVNAIGWTFDEVRRATPPILADLQQHFRLTYAHDSLADVEKNLLILRKHINSSVVKLAQIV